ncbi:MAG: hypothetical protein ABW252_10205 [Polyangiales bacterium]
MGSEPTLEQLARLRGQAVDEARRALTVAERARDQCVAVCAGARAVLEAHTQVLSAARSRFAVARTVAALHWESTATERALAARCSARTALRRAEQRLVDAEREVAARASAVRESELARRAITRTLARRTQEVTLRTERRLEDELDAVVQTRTNPR